MTRVNANTFNELEEDSAVTVEQSCPHSVYFVTGEWRACTGRRCSRWQGRWRTL